MIFLCISCQGMSLIFWRVFMMLLFSAHYVSLQHFPIFTFGFDFGMYLLAVHLLLAATVSWPLQTWTQFILKALAFSYKIIIKTENKWKQTLCWRVTKSIYMLLLSSAFKSSKSRFVQYTKSMLKYKVNSCRLDYF